MTEATFGNQHEHGTTKKNLKFNKVYSLKAGPCLICQHGGGVAFELYCSKPGLTGAVTVSQ